MPSVPANPKSAFRNPNSPKFPSGKHNMASLHRAYPSNCDGTFFVDDTCIDCDLCRQIAPTVFQEESDHSVVYHQPDSEAERLRSAMALVACPTGSIGT